MIKRFLEWLLGFFKADQKKKHKAEENIEWLEEKLKEQENEELTDSDILDHLNK